MAIAHPLSAPQRPRYLEFDQRTLDREYSPSSCVEDLDRFLAQYAEGSHAARVTLPGWMELAYGDGLQRRLCFFPASRSAQSVPLHVFIHGGYWQQLSHTDSCFPAADFAPRGSAFAAIGYPLAPEATLDEIVAACRAALAWLYLHSSELGFDSRRIFLSGTSAGGQLAAMMLSTPWEELGHPRVPIRGATVISGVFDLEPIRRSYVNEVLRLDPAAASRNSPLIHIPSHGPPLIVAWAGVETSEFKRQSREYAAAWRTAGNRCVELELAERNHFDIVFALGDGDTTLGRSVLDQMDLGAS